MPRGVRTTPKVEKVVSFKKGSSQTNVPAPITSSKKVNKVVEPPVAVDVVDSIDAENVDVTLTEDEKKVLKSEKKLIVAKMCSDCKNDCKIKIMPKHKMVKCPDFKKV